VGVTVGDTVKLWIWETLWGRYGRHHGRHHDGGHIADTKGDTERHCKTMGEGCHLLFPPALSQGSYELDTCIFSDGSGFCSQRLMVQMLFDDYVSSSGSPASTSGTGTVGRSLP